MNPKNPYEVLGVSETASSDEIKAAWRSAAKLAHPDKNGGSDQLFKEVRAAYQALETDAARKGTDERLGRVRDEERAAALRRCRASSAAAARGGGHHPRSPLSTLAQVGPGPALWNIQVVAGIAGAAALIYLGWRLLEESRTE